LKAERLNPDMPYPDWMKVIFAVSSFAAEHPKYSKDCLKCLHEWSSRGKKSNPAKLDELFQTSNGTIGVGTFIHYLKKASDGGKQSNPAQTKKVTKCLRTQQHWSKSKKLHWTRKKSR
jgi:hypothetical protein